MLRSPILLAALALAACASPASETVSFQYYFGGPSTPPEEVYAEAISGDIAADRIEATLHVTGPVRAVERRATLTGADFDSAMATIRATEIVELDPGEQTDGGSTVDVTLVHSDGHRHSGPPTNPEDWDRLVGLIQSRLAPADDSTEGAPAPE